MHRFVTLARPAALAALLFTASLPGLAAAPQDEAARLHERVQSGTSELAEVDWSAHWIGARALAEIRYANLGTLVRRGATELARADWRLDAPVAMAATEPRTVDALDPQLARYGVTEFLHSVPVVQLAVAPTGATLSRAAPR